MLFSFPHSVNGLQVHSLTAALQVLLIDCRVDFLLSLDNFNSYIITSVQPCHMKDMTFEYIDTIFNNIVS